MSAAVRSEVIPRELRGRPQWVCWRRETRPGESKPTKVPYIAGAERKASTSNPKTWRTFDEALAAFEAGGYDGIGYVFSASDPYCGIDLDDNGVDEASGQVNHEQWAWCGRWIDRFDSYTEKTPSGHGYHIIIRGKLPAEGRKKGPVEAYDQRRFFTFTGYWIGQTLKPIGERQEQLDAFYAEVFSEPKARPATTPSTRAAAVDLSGDERFAAAMRNAKFARLHGGDTSGYPSQSEARLAYLNLAAFFTGCDQTLMDTWFRASGLEQGKWDRLAERELAKAIADCTSTYSGSNPKAWPEHRVEPAHPTNGNGNGHHPEPLGDCLGCPRHCVQVDARIAELEAEVERLGAELARSRDREAGERAIRTSKAWSGKERQVVEQLATIADQARADGRTEVPVYYPDVGKKSGTSAATVSHVMKRLSAEQERRTAAADPKQPPLPIVPVHETGDDGKTRVRLLVDPASRPGRDMTILARVSRPKPEHGGARQRRCRDHPNADLVEQSYTTWTCTVCGQLADEHSTKPRRVRPLQDETQSETVSIPSPGVDIGQQDETESKLVRRLIRERAQPPIHDETLLDPARLLDLARQSDWPEVSGTGWKVGGSEERWRKLCSLPPPFLPEIAAALVRGLP